MHTYTHSFELLALHSLHFALSLLPTSLLCTVHTSLSVLCEHASTHMWLCHLCTGCCRRISFAHTPAEWAGPSPPNCPGCCSPSGSAPSPKDTGSATQWHIAVCENLTDTDHMATMNKSKVFQPRRSLSVAKLLCNY